MPLDKKDDSGKFSHWFEDMPATVRSQADTELGNGLDQSIQVGDFGVFTQRDLNSIPDLGKQHRWIRGNHDNPELIRKHPSYLGDWGWVKELELFFCGGGYSIDKASRKAYIDWWPDEELTSSQWWKAMEVYADTKPKIVVTHECPTTVKEEALRVSGSKFKSYQSGTEKNLQIMLEDHKPEVWIFGHYHRKVDVIKDGTRFVCVGSVGMAPIKDCIFEIKGLNWPEQVDIIGEYGM